MCKNMNVSVCFSRKTGLAVFPGDLRVLFILVLNVESLNGHPAQVVPLLCK